MNADKNEHWIFGGAGELVPDEKEGPTAEGILNKYPKLYREKDLSMSESPMCYGLDVPDEWLPTLDKLSEVLNDLPTYGYQISNEEIGTLQPECIAKQVKIKFGELRFYYAIDTENLPEDLIGAERELFFIRTQAFINGAIAMASQFCYRNQK